MSRYILSPAARGDLERIWDDRRERWGVDQAEAYVRVILQATERLADNPLLGRSCEDVRTGYRRHGAGSHTMFCPDYWR